MSALSARLVSLADYLDDEGDVLGTAEALRGLADELRQAEHAAGQPMTVNAAE